MTDTDTAEAVTETEPRATCLCGCEATPKHKKSRFMPGHDAQLKATLYAKVRDNDLDEDERQAARDKLDEYQWPQPSPKKARKPKIDKADNGEVESDEVTAEDL